MHRSRGRLVWLYDGPHRSHPFISLGARTLLEAGFEVWVLDRGLGGGAGPYRHLGLRWTLPPLSDDPPGDESDPTIQSPKPSRQAGALPTLVRAAAPLLRSVFPPASRTEVKNWTFLAGALFHTLQLRPSIIVATLPSAALAGWLAARRLGARLVYYPFELYGEKHTPDPAFWQRVERFLLQQGVDALITQNEFRARVYVEERGARVRPTIVHNFKPYRETRRCGKLRRLLGLDEQTRIVLYEGFLIPGRWLEHLAGAAAHLEPGAVLVFMGHRSAWWRDHVEPLLEQPELRGRARLAPWAPQDELLDYVADADAGVVIYDDRARNNYFCEPGKLSDYVLANVPVVAPDFPTIGPMVRGYGIGATFTGHHPTAIAAAIREVLDTPRPAWERALARARQHLVWATQVPDFLRAVAG